MHRDKTNSSYEELFEAFAYFKDKKDDPELYHSVEDEIMEKFILEVAQNKITTLASVRKTARDIKNRVLDVQREKWFAG